MKLSDCIEIAHQKAEGAGKKFVESLAGNIVIEFEKVGIEIDEKFLIEQLVAMVKENKSLDVIKNLDKLTLGLSIRLKMVGIIMID